MTPVFSPTRFLLGPPKNCQPRYLYHSKTLLLGSSLLGVPSGDFWSRRGMALKHWNPVKRIQAQLHGLPLLCWGMLCCLVYQYIHNHFEPIIMEKEPNHIWRRCHCTPIFHRGHSMIGRNPKKSQMELVTSRASGGEMPLKTYDDLSRWNGSGGPDPVLASCLFQKVGYNKRHRDFEEDDMMVFATDIDIEYVYFNTTIWGVMIFEHLLEKNTIFRWTYQGLSSLYMMGLFNQAPENYHRPPKTYAF